MLELGSQDLELVEAARSFLLQNYASGKHHVACALRCPGKVYFSLHLDSNGFDVCAEPTALSNALMDHQSNFISIVAVQWAESKSPIVCTPCGNCRQILSEYCPTINVIVPVNGSLKKTEISALLPLPYN